MAVRRIDGQVRVWHGGGVPGYQAFAEFVPSSNIGVVVLANSDDGNPISYGDYALRLLEPVVRESPPSSEGESIEASRYSGLYRDGVVTLFVTMLEGELWAVNLDIPNPSTARVRLEPTDEQHTFLMHFPAQIAALPEGETFTFEMGPDGSASGIRFSGGFFSRVRE